MIDVENMIKHSLIILIFPGFEEHHVETTQSTVDMRSETGKLDQC